MHNRRSQPPSPPRSPLLILAALVLFVGGVLLVYRVVPHTVLLYQDNGGMIVVGHLDDRGQHPVPQFSAAPTPAGTPLLKDLHFQPLEFAELGFYGIRMIYSHDIVTISDWITKASVWSGPLAAASFSLETNGGVSTLRDGAGRMLWTNAAEAGKPDLLFRKTPDGQGVLTDKGGATLWAGRLPPLRRSQNTVLTGGRGAAFVADGIRVTGIEGVFQVTDEDGKRLWSGHLPVRPQIVARANGTYWAVGAHGLQSGTEGTRRFSLESEMGSVTVADDHGQTLGGLPLGLMALREGARPPGGPHPPADPFRYQTPDGQLSAIGTLLLTYRDASGRVVRRSKVYRSAQGLSGVIG